MKPGGVVCGQLCSDCQILFFCWFCVNAKRSVWRLVMKTFGALLTTQVRKLERPLIWVGWPAERKMITEFDHKFACSCLNIGVSQGSCDCTCVLFCAFAGREMMNIIKVVRAECSKCNFHVTDWLNYGSFISRLNVPFVPNQLQQISTVTRHIQVLLFSTKHRLRTRRSMKSLPSTSPNASV